MKRFDLAEPATVEEAAALIADGDGVKLLAGGTALLIVIKQGVFTPTRLVSTRRIPGLDRIDEAPDGTIRIGASVTHTQAESSPVIRRRYSALAQAIHFVANARIRNMATLAGNLCHADPHSDPPPVLLALEARVRLKGLRGTRELPFREFLRGYYETALAPGEILTEIIIPPPPRPLYGAYVRCALRSATDYPSVCVTAWVSPGEAGICQELRLAVGGVTSVATRITAAEQAGPGARLTAARIEELAALGAESLEATTDLHGAAWYKRRMARVFLKRTLLEACARAGLPAG